MMKTLYENWKLREAGRILYYHKVERMNEKFGGAVTVDRTHIINI